MRIHGALAVTAVFGLLAASTAAAHPEFPDLSKYTEVDEGTYVGPKTYGYTHVQFATPDGVRCRISRFSRSGNRLSVLCWGPLPGFSDGVNTVEIQRFYPNGPTDGGSFSRHADVSSFELVGSPLPGGQPQKVDPGAYHLLPAKRSFVVRHYGSTATCVVGDARMTACEIKDQDQPGGQPWRRGFMLSPEGSWTF